MLVCAKEEVWKLRYIKLCICYKKAPKGFRFNISEAHGVGTMVNRDQKDLQRTLGFQGHSKRLPKWHSWVKTHLPVGHKWEDIRDMGSIPGLERFLEKEMATHSSILAWRTPWTEEPGGLQPTGSHRAGRN